MVALLRWSDEYVLGIPAMDADHRELMELCNQFLEQVELCAPPQRLAECVERLIERTRAHFLHEEQLLDRQGYPALVVHKDEHERLLREAEALAERLKCDGDDTEVATIILEAAEFLSSWLLDHIHNNDRPYCPHLRRLS